MRLLHCLVLLCLSLSFLAGCDDSPTDPGTTFAVFTDSGTGFSTSDVRDVNDEIVRFIPEDDTMLWVSGNLVFDNWPVEGNLLGPNHQFQVRFGTVSGQRRAYFTEAGRGTICDLRVTGSTLELIPTNIFPPQS